MVAGEMQGSVYWRLSSLPKTGFYELKPRQIILYLNDPLLQFFFENFRYCHRFTPVFLRQIALFKTHDNPAVQGVIWVQNINRLCR